MPRQRISLAIGVALLLFAGIYLTWAGVSNSSKIEINGATLDYRFVGLAVFFLAAIILIILAYLGGREKSRVVTYRAPRIRVLL